MGLEPDDLDPDELVGRGRPTILQRIAGIIGMVLILIGVGMAGVLFLGIADVLIHPQSIARPVDDWETMLRGRMSSSDSGLTIVIPLQSEAPPAPRSVADPTKPIEMGLSPRDMATTTSTQAEWGSYPAARQDTRRIVSVPVNVARSAAIGLMFLLTLILVRLAVAVIKCGGYLVSMANPLRDFYDRLVKQLAKSRRSSTLEPRDRHGRG